MNFATEHQPTKEQLDRLWAAIESGTQQEVISDPVVMASSAGWYIGLIGVGSDSSMIEPYDRFTGYMTKEEAIKYYEAHFSDEYDDEGPDLDFTSLDALVEARN